MSKADKSKKPFDKSTLKIEQIPIDKLRPNERNPRINDKAVDAVARSIQAYGFNNPIITDGDLKIAAGHTRLKAAIKLGLKEVPVIRVPGLIGSKFTGYSIADNKTAEIADWDNALLGEIVFELKQEDDFDLSTLGFDDVELSSILADYMDDDDKADEVPPVPEVAKSKLGDLYQLGDHRLLCGDATKKEDVERLMGGEKPMLICTDPPYGVSIGTCTYNPKQRIPDKLANDELRGSELSKFISAALSNFIMPGIVVYVWSAPLLEGAAMLEGLISAGIHVQSQIIWVKPSLILGQSDYQWRHEMCWYGYAKGMKRQWNGGRTETTVWECSRENDGIHPTQKPVAIMAKSVRNSSKASNIVADPFLGSGTTMIACEQLGRRCFGMEIEPRYVDVCVKRWEALTGKKAVLISE